MTEDCKNSKETIDASIKQATQYDLVLRGEMTKDVPTDEASVNTRYKALAGNLKGLEHLEDKVKDNKQLTRGYMQEEQKRLDTVECREKRGRHVATENNDDSGVYSSDSRTLIAQSTDSHVSVEDDEQSNQRNAMLIEGPWNINPSDEAPENMNMNYSKLTHDYSKSE